MKARSPRAAVRPKLVASRQGPFATVEEAIRDIAGGRMVIVVDDEDRETEAAVALCRLAGLAPVGVICEMTNPDGSMSRVPELKRFARRHGLRLITVKDLIAHRMAGEKLVERVATAKLPTEYGEFTVHGYRAKVGNTEAEHVALTMADVASGEPVLVRVHDECLTGDTFHSA